MSDTAIVDFDTPAITDFDKQDTARQTFIQLHPKGPEEGMAALHAADALAPVIHPAITATHPEIVLESLWGKVKGTATELWGKVSNAVKDIPIRREINRLTTQRFFGDESVTPRVQQLKSQLAPPEKSLPEFPKQVINSIADMGYQAKAGLEGMMGMQAGYTVGSILLGPVGGAVGGLAGGYVPLREQFDSVVASQYDTLMDYESPEGKHINPAVARGISLGMGAVMTGLQFLKVEEIPGVRGATEAVDGALVRGAMKLGLSGKLATFATAEIAQARIGVAMGAANALGNFFAKELSGMPGFTDQTVGGIMHQLGLSAGVSAATGAPLVGIGIMDVAGIVPKEIMKNAGAVDWSKEPAVAQGLREAPIAETPKAPEPVGEGRWSRDTIYEGNTPTPRADFINDALSRIRDPFTVKKDLGAGKSPSIRTAIGRLWGRARGAANMLSSSYDFNSELVLGGKDNPAYRVMTGAPRQAQLEVRPLAESLAKPIMQDYLKTRGIDDPGKMANYAMEEMTEDGVTLTRGEVMWAYLDSKNPDNWSSRLKGSYIDRAANPNETVAHPISAETFQKFFSHLDTSELAMLQKATDTMTELGPQLSAAKRLMHGEEMKVVESYWPKVVYRSEVPTDTDLVAQAEARRYMPINPDESRLIPRQDVVTPLHLGNFWQMFPELMHENALILKMGPVLQQAGKIAFDPKVSEKIERTWGKAMIASMRNNLSLMAGRGQTPQVWTNAVNALTSFTAYMDLSGNVFTGVKLAALAGRSWSYARTDAFLNGIMQAAFTPRRARRIADSISMIANQSRKIGGSMELNMLLDEGASFNKSKTIRGILNVKQKARRIGMGITKALGNWSYTADTMVSRSQTAIEIRNAQKGGKLSDDFKAATGLTEEQAAKLRPEQQEAAAGLYADYIIGESHATAYSAQRAGLMNFPEGKFLGLFKSEPLKASEVLRRSIMQAYRKPTPQNINKAIKSGVFYLVAEPLAFWGMAQGRAELLKRKRAPSFIGSSAVTLGAYVLGVGDTVQGISDRLTYGPWATQSGVNVSGQATGIGIDTVVNLIKMMQPGRPGSERHKATQQFWDDIATLGLTELEIPYQFPRAVVQGLHRRFPEVPGSVEDVVKQVGGQ